MFVLLSSLLHYTGYAKWFLCVQHYMLGLVLIAVLLVQCSFTHQITSHSSNLYAHWVQWFNLQVASSQHVQCNDITQGSKFIFLQLQFLNYLKFVKTCYSDFLRLCRIGQFGAGHFGASNSAQGHFAQGQFGTRHSDKLCIASQIFEQIWDPCKVFKKHKINCLQKQHRLSISNKKDEIPRSRWAIYELLSIIMKITSYLCGCCLNITL